MADGARPPRPELPAWLSELPPVELVEQRLAGKVAIVTGAGSSGSGIGNGRASAILMARHGARVALLDYDPAAARETLAAIASEGGEAVVVECDVRERSSCEAAVVAPRRPLRDDRHPDEQRRDPRSRGNGGGGRPGGVGCGPGREPDIDDADGEVLRSAHGSGPAGSIINVSSIAGLEGGYPDLLYPTSKGAIIQMTRAMAAQHGADGIRVNALAPGMVYTPMVAGGMDARTRQERKAQSLLGIEGTAWDVALAALFLASDDSRWVTGVVLPVDGGVTAAHVVYQRRGEEARDDRRMP